MRWLAVLSAALAGAAGPDLFDLGAARARVLFFLAHDCPIANSYAPEIRRICGDYASQHIECVLIYVDPITPDGALLSHQKEYGLAQIPAEIDRRQAWAHKTGATVTPESVVIGPKRRILYRGRIDDRHPGWRESRREPTRRDLREALSEIAAGRPVRVPRTKAVGCYIPSPPLAK
ncbi:MAG: hypothetical protein ACKV22_13420 [Bryobacteraceae bacterium]